MASALPLAALDAPLASTPAAANLIIGPSDEAPQGTDAVVTMEGMTYAFSPDDFGFSDPVDATPDQFAGIVLSSLPDRGTLMAFGSGVARGQFIAAEDLATGELTFMASEAEDVGYGTFRFQVKDTGGTIENLDDLDPTPNSFTLFFDDTDNNFMRGLYNDLLNRAPEAGGLISWLETLADGVSRENVAQAMWETAEHRGIQVDEFYQRFLNRAADPAGRQNWIGQLQAGVSETVVMAQFMMTDEYLQNAATNTAFVTQVYRDVLLREPDAGGLNAWVAALDNQTLTRVDVAAGLINTTERHSNLVDRFYDDFLDRIPDSFGEAFWTNALDDGLVDDQGLAVALLSTNEYFDMQH